MRKEIVLAVWMLAMAFGGAARADDVNDLKNHTDSFPQTHNVGTAAIYILVVYKNPSRKACAVDNVVHPVQCPKERGFAAPGRAYQGSYSPRGNIHRYAEQRLSNAVIKIQVANVYFSFAYAAILPCYHLYFFLT